MTTAREIQSQPVDEIYAALHSSSSGLTLAEAMQRLQKVGRNEIRETAHQPLYRKLLANFTHMMALLLWLGGGVALVAQLPQLAIAIWAVNLINGAFSFWQEFKAEKATDALRKLLPHSVRVLREGEERLLPAEELVPGDVILLAEGDRISADARLIDEAELRVDQSTLTGESHPVRKTSDAVLRTDLSPAETPNLVFAGTHVAAGTGKAVVFATGMQTEFGKIASLTQAVGDELSPLQKEMEHVTRIVTLIAVAVGLLFFILALAVGAVSWLEGIIFALGMIVAFVPEGLLPTVTLALAMGTQRMAKRNALIKRLSAVETLGSTSVICTDKTGTLTQNEMTVTDLWQAGRRYAVRGVGYSPEGTIVANQSATDQGIDESVAWLLRGASLCNNARLLPPTAENPQWSILGDPTEAALLVAAAKGGIDLADLLRTMPRLRELPFDSRRKRMSTVHKGDWRLETRDYFSFPVSSPGALWASPVSGLRSPVSSLPSPVSSRLAFVKGAPKEIIASCTSIYQNGEVLPLNEETRAQALAANDDYARTGLRVLAVAMRDLSHLSSSDLVPETVECELTLLGLMAMMDPPRPEVASAVKTCHGAGIRIVMITGDYGLTAESIARRIGIVRGERPAIITGVELDTMSDEALQKRLGEEVLFARVSPEHKLRVVSALQALGQVVAVTGDGVNDAPALKKADIGVAMGLSGTDVAKEAADMILTDDNFASIVNAVEEGRAVYANIKKFITYIFTSNTPEAVPFIAFVLSGARIPLALNVMQILAVDLGTDIVPALALGAEPPEPGLMDHRPRNLNEHVITRGLLLRAYGFLGLIQSLATMAAFYFHYWINGYWGQWFDLPDSGSLYQSATALALGAVVATQIGNLFAQRTTHISVFRVSFFNNRLIWIGIATELMLLLLIVYLPPLQLVFQTAPFSATAWLFLLAWVPSLLLADEARKWILRRSSKVSSGKKE